VEVEDGAEEAAGVDEAPQAISRSRARSNNSRPNSVAPLLRRP